MKPINVTTARGKIYQLIKEVNDNSDPVMITSKSGNAYLVSDDDWHSIQETLYLLSVPEMREKIVAGLNTHENDCLTENELDW